MTKKQRSRWANKIAAFVYATCALNQSDANWTVYGHEITERFQSLPKDWQKDDGLITEVQDILYGYPGITGGSDCADAEQVYMDRNKSGEVSYDLVLYTDYIADEYDAESGDEMV